MKKIATGVALSSLLAVATISINASASPGERVTTSWPAGRGAQQTVYVKRATVDLRSGPGTRDPVVATLQQGDALSVLSSDAARLKVRTANGTEGFITRIHVSDSKPSGVGGGQLIIASSSSRTQGANAGSIRGLSPIAEKYATDLRMSVDAVEQVKKMEATGDQISADEVARFQADGGIIAP